MTANRRDFLKSAGVACGGALLDTLKLAGAPAEPPAHLSPVAPVVRGADGHVVYANVEFHGVEELRAIYGSGGFRLQRVPELVRTALNPKAAARMLAPDGAEIRFVSAAPEVELTLSSPTGGIDVIVFWGEFQDVERHAIGTAPTTLKLQYPERLAQLKPEFRTRRTFSPDVWRVTLMGKRKDATVVFHNIRGHGLRPPHPQEAPARTYLAYGTSITDGFSATAMHLTYVAQVARRLRSDYVNLGCAGSAYCELELADYIAARRDWHFASLEISLNMIGAEFSPDEFRRRAEYLVDRLATSDPRRAIFCISILPFFGDYCNGITGPHGKGRTPEFRRIVREIAKPGRHPNVHLVEGAGLVSGAEAFAMDLAHPSDLGMIELAGNLATQMRRFTGF